MWFSSDHRGVRIFVRGEFVAPRQWLIRATVAGGAGIDTAVSGAAGRRTVSELWRGIVFERRVGRHLGAVAVRVVVDGDRDIARLLAATGENPTNSVTRTGTAARPPKIAVSSRTTPIPSLPGGFP